MLKSLRWFVIIWGFVAAGVYVWVGKDNPEIMGGIGLAAVISLVFMMGNLLTQWEGTVEEIKSKEVYISGADEDDIGYNKTLYYAYIRQPNGKLKKRKLGHGWQVGMYLKKERGKSSVEIVG